MGDGRLDDRFVVYDLTSAISILPLSNGGTGSNTIKSEAAGIDRVIGTNIATNKLTATAVKVTELNKLSGINTSAASIETRLTNTENHSIVGKTTHNRLHTTFPAAGDINKLVQVADVVNGSVNALEFLPKSQMISYGTFSAAGPTNLYTFPVVAPFKCHALVILKGISDSAGQEISGYETFSNANPRDTVYVTNKNSFVLSFMIPSIPNGTGIDIRIGESGSTVNSLVGLGGGSVEGLRLNILWFAY